jgi:hypothetical protein
MVTRQRIALIAAAAILAGGMAFAQFRGGGFGGGFGRGRDYGGSGSPDEPLITMEGGGTVNEDTIRTAREALSHSTETPNWTNAPGFEKDVFTFTRIIYSWTSTDPRAARSPGRLRWVNDFPDGDLNLSWRIQEMTSLRVHPDARVIRLTNPELYNYPLIHMSKPWGLDLRDEEVPILRKFLLNGGTLMVDDFWGDYQWNAFEAQIKRVLPERPWTELSLDHPLFHCVFDIQVKEMNKLQVPSIHRWDATHDPESGQYGGYGARPGDGDPDMHVRAWLDDKGRILVIALHNTNTGDGWEREGEQHEYFQIFSEQRAYPVAMNLIFYTMTH